MTAGVQDGGAVPPIYSDLLEALQGPDDELGTQLLFSFIFLQAQTLGMNEVTEDFCAKVIEHIGTLEVSTAKFTAAEKALHLAAKGDFQRSGKLIREHMLEVAEHKALENIAARYVPIGFRRTEQMRDFGERGGSVPKEQGRKNRNNILDAVWEIFRSINNKPSDHELARQVSKRIGVSKHTVRRHLRKAKPDIETLWVNAHDDKG